MKGECFSYHIITKRKPNDHPLTNYSHFNDPPPPPPCISTLNKSVFFNVFFLIDTFLKINFIIEGSNLVCKTSRKLVSNQWFRNDVSVKVFKTSYKSCRLVFEISLREIYENVLQTQYSTYKCICGSFEDPTMVLVRTTWISVLERASSLGFKTPRKLVLGALKIRLQGDGSVNVFKSSYTSLRPVFATGLQTGYEDVLLT